jgi:hypothetical protein
LVVGRWVMFILTLSFFILLHKLSLSSVPAIP